MMAMRSSPRLSSPSSSPRVRVESCALVRDCPARDPGTSAARRHGSGARRHRRGRLSSPERPPVTPADKAAAPKTPPRQPPAAAAPQPAAADRPGDRPGAAASDSAAGATARRQRPAERRPPHKCAIVWCRTKQKLDLIQRHQLNAGKRADYDSARRFLSQAETAVKENNLLLAESSVEKAETLADGLK